ncbi:hypothetical protein CERSUDRAFT_99574 [Gelatoporia subvermispora B]|uniref:Uncharacterized protein n=1 Tax=Ceriporiopsis subvermispora (strain B) TaxID=914234 RepID=M2Q5S3_CERS8|nr:hypothetical protein CERSUDRAFT_99574 [Gelatoporia subvermispora B]
MLKQTDRRKYTHTVASIQGDRLRASCKRVILSRRLQLLSPESERRRLPVITRQSYRVLAAKSIRSSVLGTERSKINQKDVRPISHAVEPEPACSTDEISEQTRAQGLSNVDEAPTVDETGPAAIGTHKQERKSLEKTITEGHNEASSEHCERRPATINDSLSAQQPNSMTITVPEGQAPSSSRLASPEAANTGSTVESPIIKTPPSTLASESNVVVREHDTANDSWLGSNWLVQLLKNPCARTTSDISLQREEFGGDVERRLRRLRELRERLKRAAKHPEGNHRPSRLECIVRGASYLVT